MSDQLDEAPSPDARTVVVTPLVVNLTPAEIAARVATRLDAARADKVDAINAERNRRLLLGASHGGKRFSMDGDSRADQGGMATTAALVLAGALSWPASYARGWISLDNSRLPLPTAQDGIALAAAVAGAYSEIVQHARDLKDDALTAVDPAAVDEFGGWPT
ncbi:hypothetical protein ACIU1J_01985 [Azospirillum doebereinerae]|uniref:DUF4376 domain-containing protein n=1 Tax=Azospirillum doebereinerae TaxID=92933 RepID=UPI00384B3D6B